jgi:hypothetical protein
MTILYEFEFSTGPIRIFKPRGDEFSDLLYLFVTGNITYVLYILDYIKYNLIFLFLDSIHLFFNNTIQINMENSLLDLNIFMQKYGSNDIQQYLLLKNIENTLKFDLLMYEFTNYGFLKGIFYRSNLPIFFYFGILFILTTISSLVLLSYYGFYGVFFLNLISIILF